MKPVVAVHPVRIHQQVIRWMRRVADAGEQCHCKMHIRVCLAEANGGVRHQIRRSKHTHMQCSRLLIRHLPHHFRNVRKLIQRLLQFVRQPLTVGRERNAAPLARNQRHTQFALQPLHRFRQRGLRNVQRFGGARHVLLAYSLPLFGSIIFQQLYNIADSFVAGHFISTEALAAVGNSSEITLIFIAIAFGCNIGTSVVTANLFGQKEMKQVHTCVTTALIFCGILGVLLSVVGILTSEWMLTLLDTPVETMKDSVAYIQIYLMSYVFLMLYQVATGIFSALGDSKTPFYFLAVSSITNIFVDILFVRDFHMGVPGVAWATFLCQSISGIVAVIFVLKKVHEVVGGEKCPLFSGVLLKKMLIIAIPSAIQQSFISVGNILVQRVINGFGTACMGGYTAAIKLNNMFVTSVTALGNGMSNYTSQNLGAGKNERVRHGCRSGVTIGMTMGAIFAVVFYVFAKPLVYAFISDGNLEAVDVGVDFLHIVTPFYVFLSIKLMVDGVQRGAARMLQFMIATLSDLFLRVVLSFTLSPIFGIRGVWYSWPIGWIVGIVLSATLYLVWARKLTSGEEKTPVKAE